MRLLVPAGRRRRGTDSELGGWGRRCNGTERYKTWQHSGVSPELHGWDIFTSLFASMQGRVTGTTPVFQS